MQLDPPALRRPVPPARHHRRRPADAGGARSCSRPGWWRPRSCAATWSTASTAVARRPRCRSSRTRRTGVRSHRAPASRADGRCRAEFVVQFNDSEGTSDGRPIRCPAGRDRAAAEAADAESQPGAGAGRASRSTSTPSPAARRGGWSPMPLDNGNGSVMVAQSLERHGPHHPATRRHPGGGRRHPAGAAGRRRDLRRTAKSARTGGRRAHRGRDRRRGSEPAGAAAGSADRGRAVVARAEPDARADRDRVRAADRVGVRGPPVRGAAGSEDAAAVGGGGPAVGGPDAAVRRGRLPRAADAADLDPWLRGAHPAARRRRRIRTPCGGSRTRPSGWDCSSTTCCCSPGSISSGR